MVGALGGYWWIGDPNDRIPGTLGRVEDAWQLNVIGRLPWEIPDGLSVVPPTAVYGSCQGIPYTLMNAYVSGETVIGSESPSDEQYTQRWTGYTLLKGGTYSHDERYFRAKFQLTGFASWWPYSRLNDSQLLEPATIQCNDGRSLTVDSVLDHHWTRRRKTTNERVFIRVNCGGNGLTLDELSRDLILPLQGLISIAVRTRVEPHDLLLDSNNIADVSRPYPVQSNPGVDYPELDESAGRNYPLFTAADVDVADFVRRWLDIAARCPAAVHMARAEYLDQSNVFESQVVETVNAMETLQRTLRLDGELPFTKKVAEALKATGLNRDDRLRVKNAVKISEIKLSDRLLWLVKGLGPDFVQWFFQGQLEEWAQVTATVRNALSHGYATRHRIERNMSVLSGILNLGRAVLGLRLFVEAGLVSGQGLVELASQTQEYRSLASQKVADWRSLCDLISNG